MTRGTEISLPPGFRFHPTDEELVVHYLCKKCASQSVPVPIIKELDLYKFDPWQLPELALCGEKDWYFFSPRDRKYPNGSRPNRAAGSGYWKATGADKPIGGPKPLGIKKALVFYAGKAPKGIKTNWIMHEYRLANVDRSASNKKHNLRLDDWVLCRIYNKKGKIEKHVTMDTGVTKFQETQEEKPNISNHAHNVVTTALPREVVMNDQSYTETSESAPWLHTSDSEHVTSPDVTWEKEVQSEQQWSELENAFDCQFNYMDGFVDDPFDQLSSLQDMLTYLK